MYCVDYIRIKGAIIDDNYGLLDKCSYCVHHSQKYNDCKLHGNDRGTIVVHGDIKYNGGKKKVFR